MAWVIRHCRHPARAQGKGFSRANGWSCPPATHHPEPTDLQVAAAGLLQCDSVRRCSAERHSPQRGTSYQEMTELRGVSWAQVTQDQHRRSPSHAQAEADPSPCPAHTHGNRHASASQSCEAAPRARIRVSHPGRAPRRAPARQSWVGVLGVTPRGQPASSALPGRRLGCPASEGETWSRAGRRAMMSERRADWEQGAAAWKGVGAWGVSKSRLVQGGWRGVCAVGVRVRSPRLV